MVYFDRYTQRRYGAMKTRDFKRWTDISAQLSFPPDHRHATVLPVPRPVVDRLRKVAGEPG